LLVSLHCYFIYFLNINVNLIVLLFLEMAVRVRVLGHSWVLHLMGAGLGAFLHPRPKPEPDLRRIGFGGGFRSSPVGAPETRKAHYSPAIPAQPSPANLAPGSPTTYIRHFALGLPTSPNPSPHRSRLPTRSGQWPPPSPCSGLPRPRGDHRLASFSASWPSLSNVVQCRSPPWHQGRALEDIHLLLPPHGARQPTGGRAQQQVPDLQR
jgi:hypothetical protein